MSAEENKAVVRRLVEAFNTQDQAALDALAATPEIAQNSRDTLKSVYATFEGHHIDITDMMAEGNRVWARIKTSGGHSGEWEGIPPTGKQWTNTGVMFLVITDGQLSKSELLFDELGHLKQLGATIAPPASKSVNA
jgi:predicted ester cyclase